MSYVLASVGSSGGTGGKRLALIAGSAAFLSTGIGFAVGNAWLLPALNALSLYPFYINLILKGRRRQAVALALLWALFLSQAVIVGTYFFPERAAQVTLKGAEYKVEMFEWVRTGEGEESSPRRFIPVHIRDLVVFSVLAVTTGGIMALFMGAVLLNYMNFYVGALVASAAHPVATAVFAWQPYAVIRVISYIILATVLTEVFFGIVTRHRLRWAALKGYVIVGVTGVILDIMVKSAAAPLWSKILRWTTRL